ncbi:putative Ca2+/H+ antiporter (TMEM165/GDT1 family) [Oceanisphaera litoralis]|uniref:TMEM165/GDT1 family protein n=1 Tax=Oceanisphaera litoralis TaxID=225144 RepID=UPI00195CEFA4|nr:TMEM165/GDT1 family protein [Oceanisphaera litoralis]MBM7455058.1 putative Ca2+/H+ antiporter (TMEM165/GDT1 family) [Oceanisphaera litoralis]
MEALTTSTLAVAIAEIGDKTQLLALLLSCRFRKPLPIIVGILAATLLNHGLAGWVGVGVQHWLSPDWLRYLLATSFFAMAVWMLIPDKLDDEDTPLHRYGPFITTLVLFFLAEMGDKTQLATVLLAARFVDDFWLVVAGTTLGMMAANVPVVLLGKNGSERIPMRWVHGASALLFLVLGITTLWW